MSATLIISPKAAWMPKNWIFSAVMRDLIEALAEELPEHTKEFADAIDGFPSASFEGVPAEDFRRIVRAVEVGLRACVKKGPDQFEPEHRYAFFGLATRYASLFALLRLDERTEPPVGNGVFVFKCGEWRAPRWAVDLVLAYLVAGLSDDDRAFESLRERFESESENLDLRSFPLEARPETRDERAWDGRIFRSGGH